MHLEPHTEPSPTDEDRHASFSLRVSRSEREAVLFLRGELDCATQHQFVAALARVDEGCPRVVLDLADLTFIDCGNIGVIHTARAAAQTRGAEVALRSPNRLVSRVLQLTDLGPAVIAADVAEPVESSRWSSVDARAAL